MEGFAPTLAIVVRLADIINQSIKYLLNKKRMAECRINCEFVSQLVEELGLCRGPKFAICH